MDAQVAAAKTAVLYRMETAEHVCPFGLKARALLRAQGFAVDDRVLRTRAETDAFKAEHDVKTTPQAFIEGARVGGYDDLRRFFGVAAPDPNAPTYRPVFALFGVAGLLALAAAYGATGEALSLRTLRWFGGFSMCLLALGKLQDIDRFATAFLGYDLLARRFLVYAKLYPFLELAAGVLMVAGILTPVAAALAGFIGVVGAVSVVKAVYIDRRQLRCACVGGNSRVPLGFLSLSENCLMVAMAGWMALRAM